MRIAYAAALVTIPSSSATRVKSGCRGMLEESTGEGVIELVASQLTLPLVV